jgi:hypothetical protein
MTAKTPGAVFDFDAAMQDLRRKLDDAAAHIASSPDHRGWSRVRAILRAASHDPDVATSPAARDFVEIMLDLAEDGGKDVVTTLEPLLLFGQAARQVEISGMRNAEARAWVRDEWREKREDYSENKSAFARDYAKLVVRKYGAKAKVTEETIKTRWLKGV